MSKKKNSKPNKEGLSRRTIIRGALGAVAAAASPFVWVPKLSHAQTAVRGEVKHLIYIRLSGGFRFTAAFNSNVDSKFNPFGRAGGVPNTTQWGVGKPLEAAPWLNDDLRALGMLPFVDMSSDVAVAPCVDHEPNSANADGNHGSALERFQTGQLGGQNGFLTMVNYGLRDKLVNGDDSILPAISFDDAVIARGAGEMAAYRPPVFRGDGFERFGFSSGNALPAWASGFEDRMDSRFTERLHKNIQSESQAYAQSRLAARRFASIFSDPLLKIQNGGSDVIDGISNNQLQTMFGNQRFQSRLALILRLFHFGCPAVFLNQGSYDLHSNEETRLADSIQDLTHGLSALSAALKSMAHKDGGSYWDHTLIVLGSEFGRTSRGKKFNSARGSDHNNDLATRWLSMPMMGGIVSKGGVGGRQFGGVRPSDLQAEGSVFSYRSMLKTMLDALGADHAPFFPNDQPINEFFG